MNHSTNLLTVNQNLFEIGYILKILNFCYFQKDFANVDKIDSMWWYFNNPISREWLRNNHRDHLETGKFWEHKFDISGFCLR